MFLIMWILWGCDSGMFDLVKEISAQWLSWGVLDDKTREQLFCYCEKNNLLATKRAVERMLEEYKIEWN